MQQQDIARFLLFSSQQQQQHAGLTAQLHALRLKCLLEAEKQQMPHSKQRLLSALSADCSSLLHSTGASQQVAEGRYTFATANSWPCTCMVSQSSQLFTVRSYTKLACRAARCAAATAAVAQAGAAPLQLPQGANTVSLQQLDFIVL